MRMGSFDLWLSSRPADEAGIAELQRLRAELGASWPQGSDDWGSYATAIAQSPAIADKAGAMASLEAAYRCFAGMAAGAGVWATIAGWTRIVGQVTPTPTSIVSVATAMAPRTDHTKGLWPCALTHGW